MPDPGPDDSPLPDDEGDEGDEGTGPEDGPDGFWASAISFISCLELVLLGNACEVNDAARRQSSRRLANFPCPRPQALRAVPRARRLWDVWKGPASAGPDGGVMAAAESLDESGSVAQPRSPAPSAGFGDLDEATVVARAQDGDLAAFEHLVESYSGRLFRLAFRLLNDRGDAEDVVQDTLTASWRALPGLDRSSAFGGWVYRTATNRCLDVLRRRSAHPEDSVDSLGLWPSPGLLSGDPHRSAELAAQFECLSRALESLPPDQRACWLLREMHDQSYAEIGAALGIGTGTVRGRLARAREKLAEAMVQWH